MLFDLKPLMTALLLATAILGAAIRSPENITGLKGLDIGGVGVDTSRRSSDRWDQ